MAEDKTFTQEELDKIINERLDRAAKKHADEIAKKDAEIDKLTKDFNEFKTKHASQDEEAAKSAKTIEELNAKIKSYENASVKRKVADELGLDSKALEFITGETEEEMKASAEKLKALTGVRTAPLASAESGQTKDKISAAFDKFNASIKSGD